jgi:hypothetical protein
MENKDNSDTFTITEPLGFEAFYYTMLNDYKDSLVFGDPFGPNKPFGPNVLMLYDRDKRTIHHSIMFVFALGNNISFPSPIEFKLKFSDNR